jgi:hypothetical protein
MRCQGMYLTGRLIEAGCIRLGRPESPGMRKGEIGEDR